MAREYSFTSQPRKKEGKQKLYNKGRRNEKTQPMGEEWTEAPGKNVDWQGATEQLHPNIDKEREPLHPTRLKRLTLRIGLPTWSTRLGSERKQYCPVWGGRKDLLPIPEWFGKGELHFYSKAYVLGALGEPLTHFEVKSERILMAELQGRGRRKIEKKEGCR